MTPQDDAPGFNSVLQRANTRKGLKGGSSGIGLTIVVFLLVAAVAAVGAWFLTRNGPSQLLSDQTTTGPAPAVASAPMNPPAAQPAPAAAVAPPTVSEPQPQAAPAARHAPPAPVRRERTVTRREPAPAERPVPTQTVTPVQPAPTPAPAPVATPPDTTATQPQPQPQAQPAQPQSQPQSAQPQSTQPQV